MLPAGFCFFSPSISSVSHAFSPSVVIGVISVSCKILFRMIMCAKFV